MSDTKKYDNNVLVVTMGYYGSGKTVYEAAIACKKAGSPLNHKACVIIADKPVRFFNILSVEFPDGAPSFRTDFIARTLGSLLVNTEDAS